MRYIRFAVAAALLLQLPGLVMAADVTAETMRSSAANSLACVNGIKSAISGTNVAQLSDKLKQALLTGAGLDQLTAGERSFYSGLQAVSVTCDAAKRAYAAQSSDIATLMAKGNPPSADFKAEFDKMASAFKLANAAQAEVGKVPEFASVFFRASINK